MKTTAQTAFDIYRRVEVGPYSVTAKEEARIAKLIAAHRPALA